MLTARGWWLFFAIVALTLAGMLRGLSGLTVSGLALLGWLGWEWLAFGVRARTALRRLSVERTLEDERGSVTALWVGKSYRVRARLRLDGRGRLPYLLASDPVPFGVEKGRGRTTAEGEVGQGSSLEIEYRVRCGGIGVARFEGLRVELADLHGLFYLEEFVRAPVEFPILPGMIAAGHVTAGGKKRQNRLLPPGHHRLRQAGSSSELLDLRDYQPGDPPKTIAWKVSARRDRLITKDFETEVPVRCTLFLDTSRSVRLPSSGREGDPPPRTEAGSRRQAPRRRRALDRLVELAAGVLEAGAAARDKMALCVFDEEEARTIAPTRAGTRRLELQRELARAAALPPLVTHTDPEPLVPLAYAVADEIYPECLRPRVNSMPAWLTWLVAFPRHPHRWRGLIEYLHRRKRSLLLLGTSLIPLTLLLLNLVALFLGWLPGWARTTLAQTTIVLSPLAFGLGWLLFLFSLLVSARLRRLARWRKRLAALLSVRYGNAPGGLEAMLQDDDQYAEYLQRFLGEHAVPFSVPLYDAQGHYLGSSPDKVPVLATALTRAVQHGRDNELYVLLVDLLELDEHLEPLLAAVRMARSRHHQVLVVCPWPPGVRRPEGEPPELPTPRELAGKPLARVLRRLTRVRLHHAYARLRRTFARLGVVVLCAAEDEAVPLILERMDQLRTVGGGRR